MVIKDVERPDENFRLLVEEQRVGDVVYTISDSYAPALGNITKRVSIADINESDFKYYETVYGLDLIDNEIKSYYLVNNKKRSTHESFYLDDKMEYYDKVMNAFDDLINSGNSEFTSKALDVIAQMKKRVDEIGNGMNAV